jgi:hypothetical protein
MKLLQNLAVLALRQLVAGASHAVGSVAGPKAAEVVADFLKDRFTDNSQRLTDALKKASERAWKALELALAGDSWWDRAKVLLANKEEQNFRLMVQTFLASAPLETPSAEFQAQCLKELRQMQNLGLFTRGDIEPKSLAQQTGKWATYTDPSGILAAEWTYLEEMATELRGSGFRTLAQFLTLKPTGEMPLLVIAVRHFFRREVESDRELFQGLAYLRMEQFHQKQETGLAALEDALARYGDRLEKLLQDVQAVVVETHGDVKDIKAEMAKQGKQLDVVGQAVFRALGQHLPTAGETPADTPKERNLRLEMLNTFLKTPHRKLEEVCPLHQEMLAKDPRFYVRLAAWYWEHGEVRDHKEMFVILLSLSQFPGHRDVGLSLLRQLPPYQVTRVVDFIHGRKEGEQKIGLFKSFPRSLRTEVERYLREREADPAWFDGTVLTARHALKRLYALLHIPPGERAQKILFEDQPPADSRLAGLKRLAKLTSPQEQAEAIVKLRIPFRVAVSVLQQITPDLLEALVDRMTPQEVINNLAMLQRRGAFGMPDVKALIDLKLEEAARDKRVSSLKADTALKAAPVSAEVKKKLDEVSDLKLKAKGRLRRATALLVDKSGSMEMALEIGKQLAAMISAICEKELYVYAFDSMAYPIEAQGKTWADWKQAFEGITAHGQTSCGIPLEMMRRKKQLVEQIILVTDEGEYDPPYFVECYLKYRQTFGLDPAVCIVRVPDSCDRLQEQCRRAGIVVSTFDFTGDYYALPNLIPLLEPPSELDLLMEIMEYPLPERKVAV